MTGAFQLRRFLHPGAAPAAVTAALRSTGRQLLSSTPAINTILAAIPDANSVTITAAATGPEAFYSPVYDPNSKLVVPGAGWTGAIESGEVPPAPAALVNAPSGWLVVPHNQRFASDLVIGVRAEAPGGTPSGIASVTCHCEGSTTVQSTRQTYYFNDGAGRPVSYMAHWFTLDVSAFLAQVPSRPGTGYWAINVWFEITANDGSMQVLQIGGPASTSPDNFQNVFRFYPDNSQYDGSLLTVAASGFGDVGTSFESVSYSGVAANHTTITAALNAHSTASRLAPRILVIGTGDYTAEPTGATYNGGKGFCTVTHSSGVQARIGKADVAAWTANKNWSPGYGGVHWLGSGIQWDFKYYGGMNFAGQSVLPYWFDCNIAGAGLVNGLSTYNLQTHVWWDRTVGGPALCTAPNQVTPTRALRSHWVTECTTDYVSTQGAMIVRGGLQSAMFLDLHDHCTLLLGARNFDSTAKNFQATIASLDAIYSGAGAVATMSVAGNVLRLTVDGVNTDSPSALSTYTMTTLAAWISTQTSWTGSVNAAVTPGDFMTDRSPVYLSASVNCKGVTGTLSTSIQVHLDYFQIQGSAGFGEINCTIADCMVFNADTMQPWFVDGNCTSLNYVNVYIESNFTNVNVVAGQWGPWNYKATNLSSCSVPLNALSPVAYAGTYDAYCKIKNNVWAGQTATGTPATNPELKNNHWAGSAYSLFPATRSGDTGGVGTSAFATLYPHFASYNTSPADVLLTNLATPNDPYDAIGATRQTTDAKGARAVRLTSRTITGAQAKTLAVDTLKEAIGTNVGQIVLSYHPGAGDSGALTTVTVQLDVAA